MKKSAQTSWTIAPLLRSQQIPNPDFTSRGRHLGSVRRKRDGVDIALVVPRQDLLVEHFEPLVVSETPKFDNGIRQTGREQLSIT